MFAQPVTLRCPAQRERSPSTIAPPPSVNNMGVSDELPFMDDEASFAEALRASPQFVGVAIPLLLAAFPGRQVLEGSVGRLTALFVEPPLAPNESRRLLGYLYELVERPEWEARCAVAREVSDVQGTHLELLVPLAPADYDGGEALVGPFASDEEARAWVAGVAEKGLAFDTMRVKGGYLVDLFLLGELLQ